MLDFGHRTGVNNEDLDDFISKVTAVDAAIKGLKDGSIDPSAEIRIPGMLTESEERKAKEEKRIREEVRKKHAEEEKSRRKDEERTRWWIGAEYMYGPRKDRHSSQSTPVAIESVTRRQMNLQTAVAERYANDYSRWDRWTPCDPASKDEEDEERVQKEQADQVAFEKANESFCQQFKDDLAVREEARQKKEEGANLSRLRGNRHFRAGQFDKSLEYYFKSLKGNPFKMETLINIAQVYLRQQYYTDALEFADRALHLDPQHIKALSRAAVAEKQLGQVHWAIADFRRALAVGGEQEELTRQLHELEQDVEDSTTEKRVQELWQQGHGENFATPAGPVDFLTADSAAEARSTDNNEALALVSLDTLLKKVREGQKEALRELPAFLSLSDAMKVHLRTSGSLVWFCEHLRASLSLIDEGPAQHNVGTQAEQRLMEEDGAVLAVLEAAVSDNCRNCLVLKEQGLFPWQLIQHFLGPGVKADNERTQSVREAKDVTRALRILQSCCKFEGCGLALASSLSCLRALLKSLETMTHLEAKEMLAQLLRDLLLTTHGRRTILKVAQELDPANVLTRQLQTHAPRADVRVRGYREALLAALANLALTEELRPGFAGRTNEELLCVLSSEQNTPASWAFALAGLINACLETSGAVRKDLVKQGAVERILCLLSASAELRARLGSDIWVRAASLLSRLVKCTAGQARVGRQKEVAKVVEVLLSIQVTEEERAHLIRTIAAVVSDRNGSHVLTSALVRELTIRLPGPRREGSKVTAETVSLPPEGVKISDDLAMSITKCLIPLPGAGVAFQTFEEEGGIERLVSLLANATDGPVRKNVAIILARIMKMGDAKAAQRIRDLRGMEMMVQLGNRLV